MDAAVHELSRDIRRAGACQRELSASARLAAARERDASARARDLVAAARDRAAEARDLAMAQHDASVAHERFGRAVTGAEIVLRAAEQRRRAAQLRAQAAEHRARAAEDRLAAAEDRGRAARDRQQAADDRAALAHALAMAETDPLTGARTRAAGLADLDHERDRCRRTGATLVVTYVDVIGLKALNDTEGHSAGDRLLRTVVALIKEHLRSYDLIIRLGGDEFLCALSNVTLAQTQRRFGAIAAALATRPGGGAIRTGFAELGEDESMAELIARADRELIRGRHGKHGH